MSTVLATPLRSRGHRRSEHHARVAPRDAERHVVKEALLCLDRLEASAPLGDLACTRLLEVRFDPVLSELPADTAIPYEVEARREYAFGRPQLSLCAQFRCFGSA